MAIGNPVSTTSSSVASKTSSVIATAGQTLFTVSGGYVTNHISVFRNGIRLVDGRDYEARNGATVTLLAAATVGDVLEFHVFDTFSVADAVTNQGGTIFGDLTVEGSIGDITANNVTGVAATFTGAVSVGGVLTYEDVTNVDSVGIITARSDLSIADKIIHTGDTNTAIRFPAADTITAETGGTERLRIDSFGRLGVGANNNSSYDSNADDLLLATSGNTGMTIRSAGATPFAMIHFADGTSDNSEKRAGRILYQHDGNNMSFHTDNTERVRITGAGNFSLGNTSVAFPSGSGLQVYDASAPRIKLTNSTTGVGSGDGSYLYVSGNDFLIENKESANMRFYTAAAERMRIDSSGRMGLGTASPKRQLHIHGGNETVKIQITNTTTGSANDGEGFQIGIAANGDAFLEQRENLPLIFYTNNTEAMRLDSSRRLLVGTTTPGDAAADNLTLHSSGDTGITIRASETDSSSIYFADGAGGTNVYTGAIIYDHATNHMSLHTNSGAERMRIDSSGRLLINHTADTAPGGYQSKLQVCDTSYQGSSISLRRDGGTGGPALVFGKSRSSSKGGVDIVSSGDNLGSVSFYGADGTDVGTPAAQIRCEVDGTPGSNDMPGRIIFATTADGAASTTERMRITSSGQMGLGTNNPVQQSGTGLHIHNAGGQTRIKLTNNITGATANDGFDIIQEHNNDVHILNHENGILKIGTNDAERMRIDSSGRLLVGTTTASGYTDRLLTVGDASTSSITAEIRSSSQGQISFADGVAQDASSYRGLVGYNHGSDYMYLYTNSAERLRIDNSGNMSLGSSTINLTAANRTTLSLNGTNSSLLAFNYSDTISGFFYAEATEFRMEANGTRPLVFRGNSATLMKINSSGTVDIGNSSSPASTNVHLDLYCNSSYDGFIRFRDESGAPGLIGFDHSSNAMQFYTNGSTEAMRIDSSGRFGISTTTPTFGQATPITTYDPKLGVEGSIIIGNLSATASDRSELQFYRRAGSSTGQPISNHDMGKIAWYGSSNDSNNSNVAWSIGVTADGNSWTSGSNRKGFMTFNNHNGEQLRITSSGYMGLGTQSPARAFHNAGPGAVTLTSGNAPQYRMVAEADAADTDDTKRAMLGLCTSNGQFFSTSVAGDTILRSTDNSALIFGEGQSERFRMDSSGRLLVGTSTSRDSNSHFQSYRSSGSAHSWLESANIANGNTCIYRAKAAGANGNTREAWIGVYKHSAITSAAGFIFLDQENSNNSYFWADNSGNFRRTGSSSNIGTTNGTVVGTQTSDERLKNVGENVSYGLAEVLQLQPKQYALKSEPDVNKIGFIAQEVESIIPEAVFDTKEELEGHEEGDRTQLGMEYVQLIPVLVNAIKEQQTTIADLQSRLSSLEG